MSANQLTIVMYHYIRPLEESRYPAIKGLRLKEFKHQLNFFKKNFCLVSVEDCLAAKKGQQALPDKAMLLTFDDGYIDHYLHAFPVMHDLGIAGAFFPVASAATSGKLLDVNKVHFVLACCEDFSGLSRKIFLKIADYRDEYGLETDKYYRETYAKANHLDSAEVILVKRLLQHALPSRVRELILNELFKEYVSEDEVAFASELYMNVDQIRLMHKSGMHIGSHTYNHPWMDRLSIEEQRAEIDKSLDFLAEVGAPKYDWSMCYPYGAYNDTLLQVLKEKNCGLGFTTIRDTAKVSSEFGLTLPRFDTNDFPKH